MNDSCKCLNGGLTKDMPTSQSPESPAALHGNGCDQSEFFGKEAHPGFSGGTSRTHIKRRQGDHTGREDRKVVTCKEC